MRSFIYNLGLATCTNFPTWIGLILFFLFSSKSSQSDASSGPELRNASEDEIVDTGMHQEESTELLTVQVLTLFILLWQATFRVANIAVNRPSWFFFPFSFSLI